MEEKIAETFWYIVGGIVALLTIVGKTWHAMIAAHKPKPGTPDAIFQRQMRDEIRRLHDEMICQRVKVNQALLEVAELRGQIKRL